MKLCKYNLKTRKRIKKLFDQGFKQIDIAKMVGCSRFTVYYSLKMLQEPEFFNEKYLKGKKSNDISRENSLKLNNNTKIIKCISRDIEEKSVQYNCNLNDKLWNGNIRIKLGETIYSGPPSKDKEGVYCNSDLDCFHSQCPQSTGLINGNSTVESANGSALPIHKNGQYKFKNNTTSGLDSCAKQNVNDQSVDSLLLKQLVSKKQHKSLDEVLGSSCSSPQSDAPVLSEESEAEPLVLEEDSRESSSLNSAETARNRQATTSFKFNSILKSSDPRNSAPRLESARSNCVSKSDMVRLMQEKCDSHNTRKNVRAPKRFCSVDDLEVDSVHKKSRNVNRSSHAARFRRLSCRSDFSDSENSDAFTSNAEQDGSKCKRSKLLESYGGMHLNGDDCQPLNGIEKMSKGRKVVRTSSEELEAAPSTKINGIDTDIDRVDINLLLEISATDRKKFENKKAKIRRKTADWNLISETEQYYNEREEILRNKSRVESTSESDGEEIHNRLHKNVKLLDEGADCTVYREKRSVNGRDRRIKSAKISDRTKGKVQATCTKELRNRSLGGIGKKPIYDLSVLEDDLSDLFDAETTLRRVGPRNRRNSGHVVAQPKRRLTSAQRFLRDNKEYYQFPETRDRLRRSLQSPIKDTNVGPSTTDDADANSIKERDRKTSTDSTKSMEATKDAGCAAATKIKSDSVECEMENIYFSFEGEPRGESWYQTYKRLMDGIPDNEYKYDEHLLRFVLPYEMPKEYFKDLYSRKFFARRKNDLNDFVRKSPRCHASTLAFISDLFPTKRKKGKPGPKKVEEVSSDGASTPSRDSSRPTTEVKESTNNVLAISLYINQLMKSSSDSPGDGHATPADTPVKAQTEGRKPPSKKRIKSKRNPATTDGSKETTHLPGKEFDNKLTCEVDNKFLAELSDYISETDLYPEDILLQDPSVALSDSYSCSCTDEKPSDGTSVCDMTDVSSECVSLCSVETVDNSFSSSKGLRNKLLKATYKKRRKNMTGWPKQRRRRPPVLAPSDDNESTSSAGTRVRPKPQLMWRKRGRSRMESRLITEGSKFMTSSTFIHTRRKTSVFHNDAWPVRHRSCK